ncbi:MAG: hypothetical protein ACM3UV_05585 [Nocardioidaceae bacterium]|jgi:hypothetical protein
MSADHGFCVANAYLDNQLTLLGDWRPRQYIALELADWDGSLEPVEATITSDEPRDLAFRLLELAKLADHRARGEQL